MEEDIKILEENLKNGTIYVNCGNSIDKALENLLTRYKQLEEENKELKHITQNYNAYQQKSDNPNTTIIIADEKWFINGYFKENFIPKSKVKEKIEELKNGTYDAKIILQQLLEENTGNHIPRID